MKRTLQIFIPAILITGMLLILIIYRQVFAPNVVIDNQTFMFHIPTGSRYEDVLELIEENDLLKNQRSFEWLSNKKNYPNHVYPGRYEILSGMNNNELIDMLRSGRQLPVQLVFNNVRTLAELAGIIGSQLEADSSGLIALFTDKTYISDLGLTQESFPSLFIPNTYEFYWNTEPNEFIRRMVREHQTFWNDQRIDLAGNIGMNSTQVSTLASIVEEETSIIDEMPIIAGVYINRLNSGIPLQADPTIKYALGDFTIQRILKRDLDVDSPYNTYKRRGLPPGPIRIPSIAALESVLNYQVHRYLYFCAREDFSGYHNFATTLSEHNSNARKYQDALNRRKIMQ